ncbi:Scarecrow-like protein 31 [Glycine soja]|uniref:Scarecrow-like protein 31 n=1 Tax=Glycine soja TaxID=3848 RepID=A0A445I189_GLYSO|nr:Scarecrow-like protein 31 [Glycine soja]
MEPNIPRGAEEQSTAYLMEDSDFSETAKFISQILMEENIDQRPLYDTLTLQVTEKSFYDALTGNIPLSPNPNQHPLLLSPQAQTTITEHGLSDLDSSLQQNLFNDADSVSHFKRGLEEATKFLPPVSNLVTGQYPNGEQPINTFEGNSYGFQSRKNHEREEIDTREEEHEGRGHKQSALSLVDETDLSDAIDRVFLSVENVCIEHSSLQNGALKPKAPEVGKGRSKKQGRKKETVDLRNLLLMCSQSVYANDIRTANELLKQIRQHSSPVGDASQRLAHYFANGLEARLIGAGSGAIGTFSFVSSKRITAAEFLKAYQVFLSATPFKKFTYFFANQMIVKAAAKAEIIHIIDYGILYGFQWPILIKFLSNREGGPPKLRITGIEFPQSGFRPTERIEETGHRLANYCKRYNVPFEYHAIASRNWETIKLEALKIERNELVAVNCHMRFEHLLDESTIEVNSPRNAFLHLIRKINPDIFTQIIINGSYDAPFFATRFREALFHYSAIYDMFDTVITSENEWRMTIESELLGREVMNVIACEGSERVQRPETYKQWQVLVSLTFRCCDKDCTKLCTKLLGKVMTRLFWPLNPLRTFACYSIHNIASGFSYRSEKKKRVLIGENRYVFSESLVEGFLEKSLSSSEGSLNEGSIAAKPRESETYIMLSSSGKFASIITLKSIFVLLRKTKKNGRKNHEREDIDTRKEEEEEERRSNKQSALNLVDESDLSDAFDRMVMLSVENIRQHSSPSGDALQRLAHYFVNGLEARLVGEGMFSFLSSKRSPAAEFLKAHQVFLSASPFKKLTYFFANKMIMKAGAKAETVHIIDLRHPIWNMKAGFKKLPLNEELLAKFRNELRKWYQRDFVLDEDKNWMLQCWKGHILYASTCWVPA